jgi:hypothetical protein
LAAADRFEVYGSRKKGAFALTGSLVFFAGAVAIWLYGDLTDPRAAFAAYVGMPLFAFVTAVATNSLIRHRPVLSATSEGVTLEQHGVFLPWAAISDVTLERKTFRGAWRSFEFAVFRTTGGGDVHSVKPWGGIMAALYERSWIGEPYAIPLSAVSQDGDELIRALAQFRRSASTIPGGVEQASP